MALGTTDISMSGIAQELGYDPPSTTPVSLAALNRAGHYNITSGTYAANAINDVDAPGMGYFRAYEHNGLLFKFTPSVGYDTVANVGSDGGATQAPPTSNAGTGHAFTNGSSAPSTTTSAGGYTVYDYTGGVYTATPGTTGDWAYFNSTATSNSFRSNFLTTGTWCTVVFWLKLDTAPAANTCIIDLCLDDDPSNYPHNSSYNGVQFVIDSTGRCRWIMGDGDGTATTDRRTFASNTNTMSTGAWYMWAIQAYGTGGSTANASTGNWSYLAHEGNETVSGDGQFLSGSGGNVAWEHSATGDQDTMYFNSGAQGNRYFDGQLGHVLVFDEKLSSTEVQRLYDRMKDYYY